MNWLNLVPFIPPKQPVEPDMRHPGARIADDAVQPARIDLLHFRGGVLKIFRT
jgi:hypothetical protein